MAEKNIRMIDYDLMSVINHGITVSSLAYQVGEEMQLPKDQCYELAVAGVLHDIGKLRLSGYVSGKESPLVVEEIKYVRRHPQLGCEALHNRGYSSFVLETIYYHHENYDGTGYPSNLEGERIPRGARVLRICDSFAALISNRTYRSAFDKDTAIELMIEDIKYFDLKMFLAFQKMLQSEELMKALDNIELCS